MKMQQSVSSTDYSLRYPPRMAETGFLYRQQLHLLACELFEAFMEGPELQIMIY